MLAAEKKKIYFDQYWREQPEARVEPRSRQRAGYVYDLLEKRSGRLLDVGCGRGVILGNFAQRGFDVEGMDISSDAVEMVKRKGYRAQVVDLERDDINEKYDVILCLEVLPQVYDPLIVLEKLIRALKDNGELIISVPNEFHIISRINILFGRSHPGDYKHSHIRLFSPHRDRKLIERAHLKIVGCKYVSIVPPGWKITSAIFEPLTQIWPTLWAISSIYRVVKNEN
jgi:2-polyprenyl-3-methyl-5-hydroxy-6-metoxy-1,4-benzoquinol methylase